MICFLFCEVKSPKSHCGSGMETYQSRVVTRHGGASTVAKMVCWNILFGFWSFPNPLQSLATSVRMCSPTKYCSNRLYQIKNLFSYIFVKRRVQTRLRSITATAEDFGLSYQRSTNGPLDETVIVTPPDVSEEVHGLRYN